MGLAVLYTTNSIKIQERKKNIIINNQVILGLGRLLSGLPIITVEIDYTRTGKSYAGQISKVSSKELTKSISTRI